MVELVDALVFIHGPCGLLDVWVQVIVPPTIILNYLNNINLRIHGDLTLISK